MSGYNMPPGVTESMIPGYYEREEDVAFQCGNEECEDTWTECVSVDPSSGGHDVEAECPSCGETANVAWEPEFIEPYDDY